MERANFFNDQDVMSDDLNNIESSVSSQVYKRSLAPLGGSGGISSLTGGNIPQGGIYGSPQDYTKTTSNFYCNQNSSTIIIVASGSALDANGNFINLSSSHTITLGDNTATSYWTETTSGTKYIKLKYQESSGSLQSDDIGINFYTRYYDSYQIRVEAASASVGEIPLGRFTADSSGYISGTITDMRQYCRTITPANSVILDPLTEPALTMGWTNVEDHVKAIGHAAISTTNPHGQNLSDLGYTGQDIADHERYSHVNGIILTSRDTTSKSSYLGSVIDLGVDYIKFQTPSNAYMLINGSIVSGSIPDLYAVSPLIANGNYWVVVNSACVPSFISQTSYIWDDENPHKYSQYLKLGSAIVNDAGISIVYTDSRQFYTMDTSDIRDASLSNRSPVAFNTSVASGSLQDELRMIRGAIGLIATGSVDAFPVSMPVIISGSGSGQKSLANQFGCVNDITSTTIANIAYQNTKPYTIFITARGVVAGYGATSAGAGYGYCIAYIGPTSTACNMQVGIVGTQKYNNFYSTDSLYTLGTMAFFVPPGWWYKITTGYAGIGGSADISYVYKFD
jgi:hypothetical protein